MDRRKFLHSVVVSSTIGLAGCTSSDESNDSNNGNGGSGSENQQDNDADDDGVVDSQDDFPHNSQWSQKKESSGRVSVNEDEWYEWSLSPSSPLGLSYEFTVRSGPSIDAVLLSEDEYEYFKNNERAKYLTEASRLDTTLAQVDTTISAGSYVLVADNTNYGEAAPPTDLDNNVADVEYNITFKR